MKRSLCTAAILAALVGVAIEETSRGQVQAPKPGANPGDLGPGAQGATLRTPGLESPSPQAPNPGVGRPATPANVMGPWNSQVRTGTATPGSTWVAQLPSNQVDINKDIEITDQQGPWVIYVMSYAGPEAPEFAREFVSELRKNLKLNAFVYNYGAAEKRREYERVQKLKQQQIDALHKAGVKEGQIMPLRIRAVKIDEQTGVLIDGGYRTRADALAALTKIRALASSKKFDPKTFSERVKLDVKIALKEEKSAKGDVLVREGEALYINPFTRAFPARNPALKQDQVPEMDDIDIKLLHKLNAQDPLSVIKTKKPFTLAIKQYNTQQIMVRNNQEAEGFLDRFKKGLTLVNGEWMDQAAINAHDLAEAFRKSGLAEAYVLHAKYCSYVTVGGYDRVDDPRLEKMQTFLEARFRDEAYRPYALFPRPAPMAVPR